MSGFQIGCLLRVMKRAVSASLTCIFALGGSVVGTITGAITGQTTETGFFRGAAIGAIAGAIVAVELLESLIEGESPQIGIFSSLVNGKIFREWVGPAMLKAYQCQINTIETSYREMSDIYDVSGTTGMSPNFIKKLPKFDIGCSKNMDSCGANICCSICLQDFEEGDRARRLPKCRHFFHLLCIDGWLVQQGTCPICRQAV